MSRTRYLVLLGLLAVLCVPVWAQVTTTSQSSFMLLDGERETEGEACVAREEVCDGIDNDCDGVVDEGCDSDGGAVTTTSGGTVTRLSTGTRTTDEGGSEGETSGDGDAGTVTTRTGGTLSTGGSTGGATRTTTLGGGERFVMREPTGNPRAYERTRPQAEARATSLPSFTCQSDSIFDCQKTRGWELPIPHADFEDLVSMIPSKQQRGVLYALFNGKPYAFNMLAAPDSSETARMTECEITPQVPIFDIQSNGKRAIVQGKNTYYDVREAVVPYREGADDTGCVLHLEEIVLEKYRCPGTILSMQFGDDVSADGVDDVVSVVACDDPFGAVDEYNEPLSARLEFDFLLGRRDGTFSNHQVIGLGYADPVRMSDATLDLRLGTRNTQDLEALVEYHTKYPHYEEMMQYVCTLEFVGHNGPFVLCALDENPTEQLIPYEMFAWKKHAPHKKATVTTAGMCQHPNQPANVVYEENQSSVAVCDASERSLGVLPIDAVADYFLPKVDRKWTQANLLSSSEFAIRVKRLQEGTHGTTIASMDDEQLMCGAPLDSMLWEDERKYGMPRELAAVDVDWHGGPELCTLCTRVSRDGGGLSLFCFENRPEAPEVTLSTEDELRLAEASGDTVRMSIATYDPTDDVLETVITIVDKSGKDVTEYFASRGQLMVDEDVVELSADAALPNISLNKAWNAEGEAKAAATSAVETVEWPVTVQAETCDPGAYCGTDALQIAFVGKAAELGVIEADNIPPLVGDLVGEDITVEEITPDVDTTFGFWGMMGGACSLLPEVSFERQVYSGPVKLTK